uniref:histidine kinase n=1 Tax=Fundidesulfovibrio putealis TaxID=270496 RepID=A0A7C4EIN8_9BACT
MPFMLPFIQSTYLSTLLECMAAGVLIMNTRGDVYAANQAAGDLLGMDRKALLAARVDARTLAGFSNPREVEDYLAGTDAGPLQAVYTLPDGSERHYTLSRSRLVEYGKVFGVVLQITDVTHIFQAHEREKRINTQRIEALGQLSMAIAHQLRNPLMTIGGFAALLERRCALDAPCADYLTAIREGAARLEAVVREVTAFTAPRAPAPAACALRAVAREALEGLDAHAVNLTPEDGWPQAVLDPDLTRDALREVLLNAVEAVAGRDAPRVEVSWRMREGLPALSVADDGPGIAGDILPFVFDPFFTTKSVGVGMGLAKARRWMREQGGDIRLEAAPGGGTLVLLLPPGANTLNTGEI